MQRVADSSAASEGLARMEPPTEFLRLARPSTVLASDAIEICERLASVTHEHLQRAAKQLIIDNHDGLILMPCSANGTLLTTRAIFCRRRRSEDHS